MLAEVLSERGLDGLGNAVEILINEAMRIERDRHLNAAAYERTDLRSGYANGFKPKQLKTRLGVSVSLLEAEVHWRAFLESLVSRGLHGLTGITSDAHSLGNAVFCVYSYELLGLNANFLEECRLY